MQKRWFLLWIFLCLCILPFLVGGSRLEFGMTFNANLAQCSGQRYVFRCSYELGELNASVLIVKYPYIFHYDESTIPNVLEMDQRPGLGPAHIPQEIRDKATTVAKGRLTLNESGQQAVSEFTWEIPQLTLNDSGVYCCWIRPDDSRLPQVSRFSTLRVRRCWSAYWSVWLSLAVASIICLALFFAAFCWLRRATKPDIRRVILISHPNEDTGWWASSLPDGSGTAWTSSLSRSHSRCSEPSSTIGQVCVDSVSTKAVIQPTVKFETICLNGSFRSRLKTAMRSHLGHVSKSKSKLEKCESAPSDDSSTLLQMNGKARLPQPLINVNNRFMSLYSIASPDLAYEIPRENLCIGSFLGGGAFGMVYKGVAKDLPGQLLGSQSVAVKTLQENFTESDVVDLLKEMDIMKQLRHHRHVIQLLAVCTQNGAPCLILEYAPHGNLRDYLRAHNHVLERSNSTLALLLNYGVQIAEGMTYLASRSIIHRDLAARNILVGTNCVLKISDFGLTRNVEYYYRKVTSGRLPVKWLAPESLFERVYTTKSDVWSFGVLLWEIFTFGSTPFPAVDPASVPTLIRSGGRNSKPKFAPDYVYALICTCWEWDARRRPTFLDLHTKLVAFEHNVRMQCDGSLESNLPTPTSSLSTFVVNGRFGGSGMFYLGAGTSKNHDAYSDLDSSAPTQYLEVGTYRPTDSIE
ncbi:hypothetical protein FGIG_03236 [Fasciola gigantica]|uniref:Protein kinase domain-containing protein n=1 Tax=Fasciola gigantica TaxID=46835 RepID=A0A504YAX5_FASGI|nr:hypothetical protein FGIG_03236 [Fasciola gigantica]